MPEEIPPKTVLRQGWFGEVIKRVYEYVVRCRGCGKQKACRLRQDSALLPPYFICDICDELLS